MISIAHLSDPHFGTQPPGVMDALRLALAALSPSAIVLSGDITQRARTEQFRSARKFRGSFAPTPFLATPGNHDIPLENVLGRALFPYRGYLREFGGALAEGVRLGGVEIAAINSTRRYRHVQGEISAGQIPAFDPESPARVRVLAFHHPMDCPTPKDDRNVLKGSARAALELERARIDLVLGGHIHDPWVSLSNARYLDVKRAFVISVAGTCLSWRTRAGAPNSFHWIEIEPEASEPALSIARHDLRDGKFTEVQRHRFMRLGEAGWTRVMTA